MASTHFLSLVDSAARARYCLTVCTFLPFLYHDCCVCNWLAMTSCFDEYVTFTLRHTRTDPHCQTRVFGLLGNTFLNNDVIVDTMQCIHPYSTALGEIDAQEAMHVNDPQQWPVMMSNSIQWKTNGVAQRTRQLGSSECRVFAGTRQGCTVLTCYDRAVHCYISEEAAPAWRTLLMTALSYWPFK